MTERRQFQLRPAVDRQGKKARCSCGWEGPWRSTPPSGHRHRDARARSKLIGADYRNHYEAEHGPWPWPF